MSLSFFTTLCSTR